MTLQRAAIRLTEIAERCGLTMEIKPPTAEQVRKIRTLFDTLAPRTQGIVLLYSRGHSFEQIAGLAGTSKYEIKMTVAAVLCEAASVLRGQLPAADFLASPSRDLRPSAGSDS